MSEKTIIQISLPEAGANLNALLKGYTKKKLADIGENHGLTIPKSWTKDRQVNSLAEAIIEQAQTIYQEVLEEVVGTLPTEDQLVYQLDSVEAVSALTPLFQKGFLFAAKADKGILLVIPEEVVQAVQHGKDLFVQSTAEPETADKNQQDESLYPNSPSVQLLKEWKSRLLKIYGTCSSDHLERVWSRRYPNELSAAEVKAILSD